MSELRIMSRPNPARPHAPDGIISIELDGKTIELPKKGRDKVIRVTGVKWHVSIEEGKENQEI